MRPPGPPHKLHSQLIGMVLFLTENEGVNALHLVKCIGDLSSKRLRYMYYS